MAVTIRLSRLGKTHSPVYRIVVQDKERHPSKRWIETIGNFYPLGQQKPGESVLTYDEARIKYWIEKGAKCSDRVWRLLQKNGMSVSRGAKQG